MRPLISTQPETEAAKVFLLLHRFPGYNEAQTIAEWLCGEEAKHCVVFRSEVLKCFTKQSLS